jgi:molecular chaperone DnaJ
MDRLKDYYELLGVPRDASRDDIRRAFRRLSRRRGRRTVEAGALDELKTAYETLADSERRRRYDLSLVSGERLEPLAWSFGTGATLPELRRPVTPEGLTGEIVLGAAEAAAGSLVSLDVPVGTTCPLCGGTGGAAFDCERCHGDGQVARRLPVPVHVPSGVRDGEVFQVRTDDPAMPLILLTVHVRRP